MLSPFLRAIFAVLSAFFGVRKRRAALADSASIRPLHVIIAGLLMVVLFVATILLIVQSVV